MTDFYITGGTLPPNTPSYIRRQADTELYQALKEGKFCYVLNSRQMGKSSLIAQVANRLREESIIVVIVDISSFSTKLTIEQWYDGWSLKWVNN